MASTPIIRFARDHPILTPLLFGMVALEVFLTKDSGPSDTVVSVRLDYKRKKKKRESNKQGIVIC